MICYSTGTGLDVSCFAIGPQAAQRCTVLIHLVLLPQLSVQLPSAMVDVVCYGTVAYYTQHCRVSEANTVPHVWLFRGSYATGTIVRPSPADVMFLPQKPYCGLRMDLRGQLLYPREHDCRPAHISEAAQDSTLQAALRTVRLDHVAQRCEHPRAPNNSVTSLQPVLRYSGYTS